MFVGISKKKSMFLIFYNFLDIANNIREKPNSSINLNESGSGVVTYNERQRDLAISAIIMDEFLKEISAISQEMSIVLLNENPSIFN